MFILPISSVIGKVQCFRLEGRVKERRHQGGYKRKARRVRLPFRRAKSVTTPSIATFFLLVLVYVQRFLPSVYGLTKVLRKYKDTNKIRKIFQSSRFNLTNKMLSRNNNTIIFPSFRLYARAYVREWTLGNLPGNIWDIFGALSKYLFRPSSFKLRFDFTRQYASCACAVFCSFWHF